MMEHVLHGPADHPKDDPAIYEDTCMACSLAVCKVCGGAEAAMPTECPGRRMSGYALDEIHAGRLDYRGGKWWGVVAASRAFNASRDPLDD